MSILHIRYAYIASELPFRELLPTAGTEALPIRFIDSKVVVSFMACITLVKMSDKFCPSHVLFIQGWHLLAKIYPLTQSYIRHMSST